MNSSPPSRSTIPFNRSTVVGCEFEAMRSAVESGRIAGDNEFSRKCQALLDERFGCRSLLTTSCTHALEMAALLLNICPGDEVIVPSFTFVSTVNAFVLRGATPIFCDSRPDTLNLDENLLPKLITPRTRAIVPVHYAGVACEMDAIGALAREKGIAVIEDNAHGLFGRYRGQWLGTLGEMATQSFHETKNISCGEGGALLLNDARFCERAEIIREKGTNRSRFFRGQIDKYSWVDLGSSYVMSDILAAYLFGQLKSADQIQSDRRRLWDHYDGQLSKWASDQGVRRPVIPPHCEQAYHMYYLLMATPGDRSAFIEHLKMRGISAVFHYLPLHLSEYASSRWGGKSGDCPIAEDVSERIVRLPFYSGMTEAEQALVVSAVREWRP